MITAAAKTFLARKHGLWIGGREVESGGGAHPVFDPATEQQIATVQLATAQDVDRAVQAARSALSGPWARFTADERTQVMLRFADLIEQRSQLIAELAVLDNGMPIAIGESCPMFCSLFLRYYSGWPSKIAGQTLPSAALGKRADELFAYTAREPVGVVGAITPWNYPSAWRC